MGKRVQSTSLSLSLSSFSRVFSSSFPLLLRLPKRKDSLVKRFLCFFWILSRGFSLTFLPSGSQY